MISDSPRSPEGGRRRSVPRGWRFPASRLALGSLISPSASWLASIRSGPTVPCERCALLSRADRDCWQPACAALAGLPATGALGGFGGAQRGHAPPDTPTSDYRPTSRAAQRVESARRGAGGSPMTRQEAGLCTASGGARLKLPTAGAGRHLGCFYAALYSRSCERDYLLAVWQRARWVMDDATTYRPHAAQGG